MLSNLNTMFQEIQKDISKNHVKLVKTLDYVVYLVNKCDYNKKNDKLQTGIHFISVY